MPIRGRIGIRRTGRGPELDRRALTCWPQRWQEIRGWDRIRLTPGLDPSDPDEQAKHNAGGKGVPHLGKT
jgi:hypothetical protein